MANNFHDQGGWYIVGVDGHVGIHFPPLMVSTFFVSVTAVHPFTLGANKQPTVLMNGGRPSVVDQHNPKFLWPHIGVYPDPLDLFTPIHTIFGEQKCWLPRLAVHICGTPAAPTAITGPISVNTECWEFCMLPLSLVFQDGTVQTTPSPDDYKAGVIRYLVETAIDLVMFFITGGFGKKPMAFSKAGLEPAFRQLQRETAKELADKSLDASADAVSDQIAKDVRNEFVSALFFDAPSGKTGWASLAYNVAKDGLGFDFKAAATSVVSGEGLPSMQWNWGDAGTTALNKFVPVSGPVGDAMDLRAEQQRINQVTSP